MKMIWAVIHDEDAQAVVDALNDENFSVTKLCSTGGFLRSGNTTLLIGTEDDKVDKVIGIISSNSKSRRLKGTYPLNTNGISGFHFPGAYEVVVGGATIFVTNIERFEKM
jgi:uncharacterized protein YaaQ